MKKFLKPFDYLFVLRPVQFYAVWAVFLAGFFVQNKFGVAATQFSANSGVVEMGDSGLLLVGLCLTLLMGAMFLLNQVMNREYSAKDQANLIAQGEITPQAALIEAGALLGLSLISAFMVSPKIVFPFVVMAALAGYLYNFKPFIWKDKPLMSLAANVIGAFLIFALGWMIRGAVTMATAVHAIPYLCLGASIYLYATLPDPKEAGAASKSLFGEKSGFEMSIYVGIALQVIATAFGFFLKDETIFYAAFFAIPFSVWAAVKLKMEDVRRTVGYSILLLTLAVLIKYQIEFHSYALFFGMVIFYFLAKAYYKFRFGLDYPRIGA